MSVEPPYTFEEVLENFTAVLASMDFTRELSVLGLKRLHFRRRRRLARELQALSVALWRLTLLRSFPHDGERMFETFLAQRAEYPEHSGEGKRARAFNELVRGYVALLQEKGDGDFMVVSTHIVELCKRSGADVAAQSLKLALLIRNTYTMIFERLI